MTNIKAFLGAAAITAVAAVPLYYADAAGRTERVAADLEKRTATVAWTWTDMTDHAVRLSLTRNGEDFPTAGWGGTLFIGDGGLGCAVEGNADGYNELFFDVGREYVPTNGKYAVQIIATNVTGRVEEWARGTLTVRANPAADGMPTNWSAYADIARRVAPYIDAQGILSDPANAAALWGAVSNRTDALIGAIAPKADLTDATNYTDKVAGELADGARTVQYANNSGHADYSTLLYDEEGASTYNASGLIRASTNAALAAVGPVAVAATNYTDEALGAFAATGAVARAAAYGTPTRWVDATGCVWLVARRGAWTVTHTPAIAGGDEFYGPIYATDDSFVGDYFDGAGWYIASSTMTYERIGGDEIEEFVRSWEGVAGNYTTVAVRAISTNLVGRVALTNDIPATFEEIDPTVPEWAKADSKPQYSAGEVGAYPATDGNSLANIVNSWEGYWSGTNVMFEVTNYFGNTTGELPRLRIRELRDGAWTNVWDEAHKFDVCKDEILREVAASNATVLAAVADGYAPKAWGAYTDKGETNVVGNSVWMTSPETYFAGGTEYQRVAVGAGAICVLTDNGAGAYTAGEAGTFRFQDEGGTNYFGFAKSDSYTIGCRTDGIAVEGNLVTLRYDVIMGGTDVPVVYWRLALDAGAWVQLNNSDGTACDGAPYTVTWYTSGGSYYAAINCGSNGSGFFKAETSVAGDVVFETNMKVRLGGGIECTNTQSGAVGIIRPTYNGSTVNWTWSAR